MRYVGAILRLLLSVFSGVEMGTKWSESNRPAERRSLWFRSGQRLISSLAVLWIWFLPTQFNAAQKAEVRGTGAKTTGNLADYKRTIEGPLTSQAFPKPWFTPEIEERLRRGDARPALEALTLRWSGEEEHPGLPIGTGEVGGYLNNYALNTATVNDKLYGPLRRMIRHGFQAKEWFDPYEPPRFEYHLASRTGMVRLLCDVTVDGQLHTEDIGLDWELELSFADAAVRSRKGQLNQLKAEVTAFASWASPRLVVFRVRLENPSDKPHRVHIRARPSNEGIHHDLAGRMALVKRPGDLRVGVLDAYFSTYRVAAAEDNGGDRELAPGATMETTLWFGLGGSGCPVDVEEVVREARQAGFEAVFAAHRAAVDRFWNRGFVLVGDRQLQLGIVEGLYTAAGHYGGRQLPGSGLLGSGGWSGVSSAWGTLHGVMLLLRYGHADRVRPAQDKIIDDVLTAEHPFINFAWDLRADGTSGRYRDELHESSTGMAMTTGFEMAARLTGDEKWLAERVTPAVLRLAEAETEGLKEYPEGLRKSPRWQRNDGREVIIRSVESDRSPGWYSDTALALKGLLLMADRLGRVDRFKQLADRIDVPKAGDYYAFWHGDGFPDVPRTGWDEKRWNFHPACVGAYPFTVGLGDARVARSLRFPHTQPLTDASFTGGYPMVQCLAAARLGMSEFLGYLVTQTGKWLDPLAKVDVERCVTVTDNDSFLLSFVNWPLLASEMLLGVHDDVLRLLPALPAHWRVHPWSAVRLPIPGGDADVNWNPSTQTAKAIVRVNRDGKLRFAVPAWLAASNLPTGAMPVGRDDPAAGEGDPAATLYAAPVRRGEPMEIRLHAVPASAHNRQTERNSADQPGVAPSDGRRATGRSL